MTEDIEICIVNPAVRTLFTFHALFGKDTGYKKNYGDTVLFLK